MTDAATPCVLIPVYNHAGAITATCEGVRRLGIPLLLVDDGSDAECAALLERLAEADDVSLVRLPVNRGKGRRSRPGCAKPPGWASATPCRSMPTASTKRPTCRHSLPISTPAISACASATRASMPACPVIATMRAT